MKVTWLFRAMAVGTINLLQLLLSTASYASSLDQDEAAVLVGKEKLIPLEQLLNRHEEKINGRLIDLELEHEEGLLVYELEVLDSTGRVREYLIDAQTGDWLGEE